MPAPIVRAPLSDEAKLQLSVLLEFERVAEEQLGQLREQISDIRETCLHDMQECFPEIRAGWKRCTHCKLLRHPTD